MEPINESGVVEQASRLPQTPWANVDRLQNDVSFATVHNHLSAKFITSFNESKLEVFDYNSRGVCRLMSRFDFADIYKDSTATISLVTRLIDRFEVASQFRHPHKLLVVISLENRTRNFISLVDIRLSKILNTIEFPFMVTSLEVIFTGSFSNLDNWPLIPELLCMKGILAVGCESGLVFFIDLILDCISPVPLIAKKANFLARLGQQHMEHANKRRTAIFHNQYIGIGLNSEAKAKGKFNYRDESHILASYHAYDVYISSLHFIPQLSILCVGYNFGGFHLYNLHTFALECSSQIDPQLLPTIAFAYQVPEHDPKNFSYLTVVRGIDIRTPCSKPIDSCCTSVLYLLAFETKKTMCDWGLYYSGFKLCQPKFEFTLADGSPCSEKSLTKPASNVQSKLISLFTINQIVWLKGDEDQSAGMDQNYVLMAWQCQAGGKSSPNYYFLIFDLNQWYNSQMPAHFCLLDSSSQCPFLSIYSLSSILRKLTPESIQSLDVHANTLSKFVPGSAYQELHSFPSSLSFSIQLATQTNLIRVRFESEQKRLLARFVAKREPASRVLWDKPEMFVNKCLQLAILGPEQALAITSGGADECTLSKICLDVLFENRITSFLVRLARECASAEQSQLNTPECHLAHLLEWCWDKVNQVKDNLDAISYGLFTGSPLLEHNKNRLGALETDLATLVLMLRQMQTSSQVLTQQSMEELEARKEAIELLRSYLKLVLILVEIRLLPERSDGQPIDCHQKTIVYDYDKLSQFYRERRSRLGDGYHLCIDVVLKHSDIEWESISEECAPRDGRLYPPPSIYSLTRLYLNESIPLVCKETIVFYFLLDLAGGEWNQTILTLLNSLSLSQGGQHFVRGLHRLDHGEYEPALQHLIHPMISSSLTNWKRDMAMFTQVMLTIVKLFLQDNQFHSALVCVQTCAHFPLDGEESETLYLQLLLLNDNLSGAFEFQRNRRTQANAYAMLCRLLYIAERKSMLEKVSRMSLDAFEESCLVDYLLKSDNVDSKRILVLYFIEHNKLQEAIKLTKLFQHALAFRPQELKRIQACEARVPEDVTGLVEQISMAQDVEKACFKPDQAVLKLAPQQKTVSIFSSSTRIERQLEMCETASRTPIRVRKSNSMYLSPRVQGSKVAKSKTSRSLLKSLLKDLTPMRMSKHVNLAEQMQTFATPVKPILKLRASSVDSFEVSSITSSQKSKVSFSLAGKEKKERKTKDKNKVRLKKAAENVVLQETLNDADCLTNYTDSEAGEIDMVENQDNLHTPTTSKRARRPRSESREGTPLRRSARKKK